MAIQRFQENMNIIGAMSDNPRLDGYTSQELRETFDKHGIFIKEYLNNVVAPAIDAINAGAIVMSDTVPEISPVLWIDTSGDTVRFVYIDERELHTPILPLTDISCIRGLNEAIGAVTVTLSAENWSATSPYSQIVQVSGMTSDWVPGAFVVVPPAIEADEESVTEAASFVDKILPSAGNLTFYCRDDKPLVDFTVRIPGLYERGD